jgi:hypothetical protein
VTGLRWRCGLCVQTDCSPDRSRHVPDSRRVLRTRASGRVGKPGSCARSGRFASASAGVHQTLAMARSRRIVIVGAHD